MSVYGQARSSTVNFIFSVYGLPADDHIGLFVTTFPTPPSYTASSVS